MKMDMSGIEFTDLFLVFAIGFIAALICVPLSIKLASKIGAIDIPTDGRRVHNRPVPRIGGVGIFLGVSFAYVFAISKGFCQYKNVEPRVLYVVLICGALIFALGFIDDLKDISPLTKLIGQIVAAAIVAAYGVRFNAIGGFIGVGKQDVDGALSILMTILWIIAITNTINLVDGLDGLAAGIVTIASACIAYAAYINGNYPTCFTMITLAGGSMGFLPYNLYPAKTFMGDCGSQYLGFMIATFSIVGPPVKGPTLIALIIPVLTLSLPIFDTVFAILRRLINHKPIMEADKGHIHHRLLSSGMGQRRTVLTMYGICAIMGIAGILFSRQLYVETAGLLIVALIYLVVVLTDPNRKNPKSRR